MEAKMPSWELNLQCLNLWMYLYYFEHHDVARWSQARRELQGRAIKSGVIVTPQLPYRLSNG